MALARLAFPLMSASLHHPDDLPSHASLPIPASATSGCLERAHKIHFSCLDKVIGNTRHIRSLVRSIVN